MNRALGLLAGRRLVAAAAVGALRLGALLYPPLPERMAIHRDASGQVDGTAARPVAVLSMPAIVVVVSLLLELAGSDAVDRIVRSVAMGLLLGVEIVVFAVNLGVSVPIVPIAMAGAPVVAGFAVRFERRSAGG